MYTAGDLAPIFSFIEPVTDKECYINYTVLIPNIIFL